MREILSAEMSRTHQMAKRLVKELQSMGKQFETRTVKDSAPFPRFFDWLRNEFEEGEFLRLVTSRLFSECLGQRRGRFSRELSTSTTTTTRAHNGKVR